MHCLPAVQLEPGLAAATGLTELEIRLCDALSLDSMWVQLTDLLPRWPMLKVGTHGQRRQPEEVLPIAVDDPCWAKLTPLPYSSGWLPFGLRAHVTSSRFAQLCFAMHAPAGTERHRGP